MITTGRGRKPIDKDSKTVITAFRLAISQRDKLTLLGGGKWIREQIDAANLPAGEDLRTRE
jgi:hypothetical protein